MESRLIRSEFKKTLPAGTSTLGTSVDIVVTLNFNIRKISNLDHLVRALMRYPMP